VKDFADFAKRYFVGNWHPSFFVRDNEFNLFADLFIVLFANNY